MSLSVPPFPTMRIRFPSAAAAMASEIKPKGFVDVPLADTGRTALPDVCDAAVVPF